MRSGGRFGLGTWSTLDRRVGSAPHPSRARAVLHMAFLLGMLLLAACQGGLSPTASSTSTPGPGSTLRQTMPAQTTTTIPPTAGASPIASPTSTLTATQPNAPAPTPVPTPTPTPTRPPAAGAVPDVRLE